MRPAAMLAVGLAVSLLLTGCLSFGGPSPDSPTPTDGETQTPSPTPTSPTPSPAPSDPTPTTIPPSPEPPSPPERLPSTADCLVSDVPPAAVEAAGNSSLTGRDYPPSPAPTSITAVRSFVQSFESVLVYNTMLAESSGSDPLTRANVSATEADVSRIEGGYFAIVEVSATRTHRSGPQEDVVSESVYRLTADRIQRSTRGDGGFRVFRTVVGC